MNSSFLIKNDIFGANIDFFSALPKELKEEILVKYLGVKDIGRAARVCKNWFEVVKEKIGMFRVVVVGDILKDIEGIGDVICEEANRLGGNSSSICINERFFKMRLSENEYGCVLGKIRKVFQVIKSGNIFDGCNKDLRGILIKLIRGSYIRYCEKYKNVEGCLGNKLRADRVCLSEEDEGFDSLKKRFWHFILADRDLTILNASNTMDTVEGLGILIGIVCYREFWIKVGEWLMEEGWSDEESKGEVREATSCLLEDRKENELRFKLVEGSWE